MTCLEKYMSEHPDVPKERILSQYCPNGSGAMYEMDDPEYCPQENGTPACVKCWNREFIDTKPTNEEKTGLAITCLEKYMPEHPDEDADAVINNKCPHWDECGDLLPIPDACECGASCDCAWCWNREIPIMEEPHIRDSGTRQEFSTGAVRDIQKGKGRCDLMPLDVVSAYYHHIHKDCVDSWIFYHLDNFQRDGEIKHLFMVLDRFRIFPDIPTMLLEVSKHFEEGAEKYGENNWQKGLPVKCYINSAVRHYLKWLRGDKDEPHDRAFCWNILCAIWTCKHKPELNSYGSKKCPVCGEPLQNDAKACDNCRVYIGETDFDPDSLMGEYEEENE